MTPFRRNIPSPFSGLHGTKNQDENDDPLRSLYHHHHCHRCEDFKSNKGFKLHLVVLKVVTKKIGILAVDYTMFDLKNDISLRNVTKTAFL
jgi:hypothetical protein